MDKYDEQAERLLPCEWLTDHGVTEDCKYADKWDVCHTCACRPATAAALREPGELIDELWAALTPEKRHELNLKWRDSGKLPK